MKAVAGTAPCRAGAVRVASWRSEGWIGMPGTFSLPPGKVHVNSSVMLLRHSHCVIPAAPGRGWEEVC